MSALGAVMLSWQSPGAVPSLAFNLARIQRVRERPTSFIIGLPITYLLYESPYCSRTTSPPAADNCITNLRHLELP